MEAKTKERIDAVRARLDALRFRLAEPTLHEALAARGLRRAEKALGLYRHVIRRNSDDAIVCEGTASDVWAFLNAEAR